MIHVARVHDDHYLVDVYTQLVGDQARLRSPTLYSIVSEKHGEDNTGYLVAELETGVYWCACDDFNYNRVENGQVAGECKHVQAVKLRTRQSVESDQATLEEADDA